MTFAECLTFNFRYLFVNFKRKHGFTPAQHAIRDCGDEGRDPKVGKITTAKCEFSNAFNVIVETNGSSEREREGIMVNSPECAGDVYLRNRVITAPREGTFPNFHEAFTQLHLGQLLAFIKCFIGDRSDGGVNPNAYYILGNIDSTRPRVDEDLS